MDINLFKQKILKTIEDLSFQDLLNSEKLSEFVEELEYFLERSQGGEYVN